MLDITQVTDNWLKAMARAQCEPVILVTIDVDGSTQFKFVSHTGTALAYDASLASISNVSSKIDPVERTFSNNAMTLEFLDDSAIRDIIVNNRLRGKRIIIELGERTLAEADYAPYFRGIFTDWRGEGGRIVVEASDAYEILGPSLVYNRSWKRKHPLEVIKDILDNVAFVPAELIDATSLDPDTYTADVSHWAISGNIGKKVWAYPPPVYNTKEMVDELASLMNGGLYPDEDGKLSFARFDSTAAASQAWTADDWTDLQQIDTNTDIINREYAQTHTANPFQRRPATDYYTSIPVPTMYHGNTDSQTNFAFPGAGSQFFEHRWGTPWIGGHSKVDGADTEFGTDSSLPTFAFDNGVGTFTVGEQITGDAAGDGVITAVTNGVTGTIEFTQTAAFVNDEAVTGADSGATCDVDGATAVGADYTVDLHITNATFAGTRDDGSSGWETSVARPVYMLFHEIEHPTRGTHFEVIKFDKFLKSPIKSDSDGDATVGTWTVAKNGRKWTDATPSNTGDAIFNSDPMRIYEVTPIIDRMQRVIERSSEGLPIISLRTDLSKYAVQIGDLVTIAGATTYVNYGEDGLTGSVKWEVIGKEPNPLGDSPGIKWTLARATIQSGYATEWYPTTASTYAHAQYDWQDILDGWNNGGFGDIIRDGLNVTDATGLDIDIGRGTAITSAGQNPHAGTSGVTLDNAATYWVFYNPASDKVQMVKQAAEAVPDAGLVRLAKVVTAGGAIDSITDLRETFTGTAKPASIGGAQGNTLNGAFSLRTRPYHLPDFWEYDAENSTGTYGTDITVGAGGLKTGSNVIAFAATTNVPRFLSGWYPITEGRLYRATYSVQTSGTTVNPSMLVDWYQADKITYISSGGISGKGHNASGAQEVHSSTDLAPANARWARLRLSKDAVAESVAWDMVRLDPIPAYALAWEGSNNAISSAAWFRVELDTEIDPANTFNTTSFYWQAPMDSLIDVSACVSASLIGTDDLLQCAIYRNRLSGGSYVGASAQALGCTSQGEASANTVASNVSVVGLEVTQGDRISLWARSPDDTSYTVLAGQSLTYMYVRQVEPRF